MRSYVRARGSAQRAQHPDLRDIGASLPNRRKAKPKSKRRRHRAHRPKRPPKERYAISAGYSLDYRMDGLIKRDD